MKPVNLLLFHSRTTSFDFVLHFLFLLQSFFVPYPLIMTKSCCIFVNIQYIPCSTLWFFPPVKHSTFRRVTAAARRFDTTCRVLCPALTNTCKCTSGSVTRQTREGTCGTRIDIQSATTTQRVELSKRWVGLTGSVDTRSSTPCTQRTCRC